MDELGPVFDLGPVLSNLPHDINFLINLEQIVCLPKSLKIKSKRPRICFYFIPLINRGENINV